MTGARLHRPAVATSTSHVVTPDGSPSPGEPGPPDSARHDRHPPPGGLRAVIGRAGPRVAVISVIGDVDLATVDVFATALDGTADADPGGRLVLELNRVSFLGARGLDVIVTAHRRACRRAGDLVLVVDQVAPAAVALRFLPAGEGPAVYASLTAALAARPVDGHDCDDGTGT